MLQCAMFMLIELTSSFICWQFAFNNKTLISLAQAKQSLHQISVEIALRRFEIYSAHRTSVTMGILTTEDDIPHRTFWAKLRRWAGLKPD